MRFLHKTIGASVLAAALVILPTGVAQAQSSNFAALSSGSANSVTESDNVRELHQALIDINVRSGNSINSEATRAAQVLLDRALSGEIVYYENIHYSETYNPYTQNTVVRIPKNDIDAMIQILQQSENDSPYGAPFGVAVGESLNFYYAAEAVIIR